MAQAIKDMLDQDITDLTALEDLGRLLAEHKVKTAQIRRFFGAMKRIQADFDRLKPEIILMEPRLAYAVGRAKEGKAGLDLLFRNLGPLIREIGTNKQKFNRFVRVSEAIVAYHKKHGGKE